MDLTTPEGHLALAYVDAVQRQGYVLTVDEFNAYISQPGRRAPQHELIPARHPYSGALADAARAMRPQLKVMREALGFVDEQLVERAPGEQVVDWLIRLRWLERTDEQHVRITPLGAAVLASLEQQDLDEDVPVAVVLDRDDPVASARVIGKLRDVNAVTLVDPYFSIDRLVEVIQATSVERVLTSRRDAKKAAGLAFALGSLDAGRPFEVRASDVFHDRFAVPATGPVWLLGTSLTGVGKRLAMMVELRDDAVAGDIRGRVEQAWADAEPLVPYESDDPPDAETTV